MSPDFTPDPIFDLIGRDPDVIALVGYVDEADDHISLFQDPELRISMDIPKSEVLQRHRIPAEADLLGGRSLVWVNADYMREDMAADLRRQLADTFLVGEFAAGLLLPETREDVARYLTLVARRSVPRWACP